MDFTHEIQVATRHYWRAFRFIEKNSLWSLLILPALLNLLIAVFISFFAIKSSGQLVAWFMKNFHFANTENSFHRFLESAILLILRGMVVFLYLKIFRYLVLILVAPLLTYISEKVQSLDLDIHEHIEPIRYFNEFTRGMRIAFRNFFFELLFTVAILVITFLITWLVPLAPILILMVESYYMGYAMMDYRNEYLKMSAKESRKLVNQHLGLVIGNGLFFNLSLLIPLIGILFAPVFALIAAGLSLNYVEKRKNILCPSDQSTLIMAKS